MSEFEDIFNSIYGETHPDEPLPEEAPPEDFFSVVQEPQEYYQNEESRESEEEFDELSFSDDDFTHRSFGEFLSSRIAALILKIRGSVSPDETAATFEEEEAETEQELPLLPASKYYGSYIHSLRTRFMLSLPAAFLLLYISCGLPVPGMLNNLKVLSSCCLAAQLTIIIICLDVFTNGVLNMFRGRAGADSLACIACMLTAFDAVSVISGNSSSHVPACFISSVSLIGTLLASLLSARGMRKALRVPAIGKLRYCVTVEGNITGHSLTLLKSDRSLDGFLKRMEEAPPDESFYCKIFPVLLILSFGLTALTVFIKKCLPDALFILSLYVSLSVPFTALLCFSLPFCSGSARIFEKGAAIAGWSGVSDIGHSRDMIVTGRDLFPPERIQIENVRIFADYDSSKIISYAASMIHYSASALEPAFEALLSENGCGLLRVDNFEPLAGGGLKGMIEGQDILCGNADLMRLMNIKVPYKLVGSSCVLLAVNGILYGIFNIRYSPDPKVRRALVSLMGSNRHPVFAVRDFNVTPEMIRDCFDVATDGYDFPPYTERFPISEAAPSGSSQIAGAVCREGLGPLTALADTGRSIYRTVRINLIITVISALLGMLLVFLLFLKNASVSFSLLFFYMLICSGPVIILGILSSSKR